MGLRPTCRNWTCRLPACDPDLLDASRSALRAPSAPHVPSLARAIASLLDGGRHDLVQWLGTCDVRRVRDPGPACDGPLLWPCLSTVLPTARSLSIAAGAPLRGAEVAALDAARYKPGFVLGTSASAFPQSCARDVHGAGDQADGCRRSGRVSDDRSVGRTRLLHLAGLDTRSGGSSARVHLRIVRVGGVICTLAAGPPQQCSFRRRRSRQKRVEKQASLASARTRRAATWQCSTKALM